MKVAKATTPGKVEKQVKLSTVKPGEVFRYAHQTFEEALNGESKEGGGFWQVVETPVKKDKITVVSVDGRALNERDGDHMVVIHQAELSIHPAELIDA